MRVGAFSALIVSLALGASAIKAVAEGLPAPLPDRGATIDCWTLPRAAHDQPEIILTFSESGMLNVSLEGQPLCKPSIACRREDRAANDKVILIEDMPEVSHHLTMVLDRDSRQLDVSDGELETGFSLKALCDVH